MPHQRKTRPGGQPDGSSHIGARVMGARAEYSLDGEGLPLPHLLGRLRVTARSNGSRFSLLFLMGALGQKTGGAMARRLSLHCRKQLPQDARGRHVKAFVEMNDLGTLFPHHGISLCQLGITGERLFDTTGIARIESAGGMPWQQHFHFAGRLSLYSLLSGIFLIFLHRPRAQPCSTPAASTARPVLACMQQAHSVRSPLSDPRDQDLRRTACAAQPAVTRLVGLGRRWVRWNGKFLRLINSRLFADWRTETIGGSRCGVCKVNQSVTVSGEGSFLPPDCSLSVLPIVSRSACSTSPRLRRISAHSLVKQR